MPGVKSAAISRYTPFGYNNDIEYVKPELELTKIPENGVGMFNNVVSPGYLATMGISVIEGRDFTEHDDDSAPKVALVTKQFASRIWPNQPALGKRFRFAKDGPMLEVIGVTSDIQYFTMGEAPKPFFFRPITQWYRGQFTLDIQTTVDPVSLINPLRAMMTEIDPALPVFDVRSMEDHIVNGRALLSTRLGAAFSGVFGALALLLAAVGLYGLMSYSVVQRTREIGIRVALGAKTSTVLRLVLRQGVTIALVGVAAGVAVAFFVTQFLSKLLYGVAPHDPLIFAGVAVTLAAVGALASLIPARRAARVDPLAALRAE
jgi:predicted permease